MAQVHNFTVDEVMQHIDSMFTPEYVATDEGQAHLNRVGKTATNESIEQRKKTNKQKKADAEYNKILSRLMESKQSAEVEKFIAGKEAWIQDYIANKA